MTGNDQWVLWNCSTKHYFPKCWREM